MTRRTLYPLLTLGATTTALLVALSTSAALQDRHGDADDNDDHPQPATHATMRLATGQFVTPTAIRDSVQQYLNPGLAAYPDFIAGEAVRSQLSPDGTTLAVITAGQNSLVRPDGSTDVAVSTQFIFLWDVQGANRAKPALTQVIQQRNAHVGLVFSHDGSTLYATGGADDAVYVYDKTGTTWALATQIGLGHSNKGVRLSVQPNASGLGLSADGNAGPRAARAQLT